MSWRAGRLANVFPGFRSVEQANPGCLQCRGLEVARIDAGMGAFANVEFLPLHDTTAILATDERQMEQLQLVKLLGLRGTWILTAPQ